MAHPAAEGVTTEQTEPRAEPRAKPRLEPGGPVRPPGVPGGERTGRADRPAGGRPGEAVLCYSQSGDGPQWDLARFG
jgi:hypothetical protein